MTSIRSCKPEFQLHELSELGDGTIMYVSGHNLNFYIYQCGISQQRGVNALRLMDNA